MSVENIKPKLNQSDKIAILGAGPAGIHMAYLLKQKGFQNITVLEKSDRIGGKSYTIFRDNVPNEMGTCYLTITYKRILELIETYNITEIALVEASQRKCFIDDNCNDEIPTTTWLMREVKKICLPKYFQFLPDKISILNLIMAIRKYDILYDKFNTNSPYDIPQNTNMTESSILAEPMQKFLINNGLSALTTVFLLQNSLMCLGYPSTIPAYYGIYWMNKYLLNTYLNFLLKGKSPNLMMMLQDGFQSIWEKLSSVSNVNVKFNTDIDYIERKPDATIPRNIRILYKDGTSEDFDVLISAIPAKDTLQLLRNSSTHEKNTFQTQIHSTVDTRLVKIQNPNKKDALVYLPYNLHFKNQHYLFAFRNALPILRKKESNEQYVITYQYFEDPSTYDSDLSNQSFIQTLEKHNIKVLDVEEKKTWRFFHRYANNDIEKKLPWKILELQGEYHTWYIGSSVSFESANAVVNFNHYILDHYVY